MTPKPEYDLAVIGAGPGGLAAARFAVQLGARVLLAERDRIGGDSTWGGSVPSKALIRVAKAAHDIRTAHRFGLAATSCAVDMEQVREYLRRKVQEIYQPTTPEALSREGIHVALGEASFQDDRTIRVGDRSIVANRYLICAGASPVTPNIERLSGTPYFTYHTIFDSPHLPESLIVIGGGPLGTELAQAFRRLGSEVTLVAPHLLPHDDPQAANVIRRVFEREGVRFVRGRAVSWRRGPNGIVVTSDTAGEAFGHALLVAVGRRPNIDGLDLDRARVAYSAKGIVVDGHLRTRNPRIYAAGDVLGVEQFAHVSSWQAVQAARNALLKRHDAGRPAPMAWVTFTDPEVAQVGVSEIDALQRWGDKVVVTQWNITRVDRATCDDDEDGFIKVLSDRKGVVVGATIVASRAGEMSGEMCVAIANGLKVGDIAAAMHASPTYATVLQQMASEVEVARWTSSLAGRLTKRFRGLG